MISYISFSDEFCKLAAQPLASPMMTEDDAQRAMSRLRFMQTSRDPGALASSAMVGASVNPFAAALARGVAGTSKILKQDPIRGAVPFNWRNPLRSINWAGITRQAAGDAVSGAIAGGALPLVRSHAEEHTQRQRLRDYLAQPAASGDSALRQQVEGSLGAQ